MKITVIIPCYHKHFKLIERVLTCFLNNTYKPDQVIVSLNGCKYIPENEINDFYLKYKNLFDDFLILKTFELLSRPKARNICFEYIKNDIVCFSDSDDYEHPQRFEIVKYFFENKNIDHLLHSYILSKCYNDKCNKCFLCSNNYENKFKIYDISKIDYCSKEIINKINFPDDSIKPNVKSVLAFNKDCKQIMPVHGLVCIKKNVLDKIKFNELYLRGQDSLFSQEVIQTFKNTIVIDAKLHIYENGWIPSYKNFVNIDINDKKLYLNMGSSNPPHPGIPRTNREIDLISKTIKNLLEK
jgi:glycosyltransferase involved in cell wall biosynthesis